MADQKVNEEIRERLPIEQLVGQYVPLKKAGRIYKGLCPFHGEKTPSFTVSPERGIYKCFGCGKGGDIFDFIMEIEGLTFPEAVKILGEKAGVEVPEWKPKAGNSNNTPSRTRLFEVNSFVARLWHTILTKHPKAEMARTYLHGRGLTDESMQNFQIGYAPLGNVTANELQKAGFTRAETAQAGDPGRFQDRIVFPIADITGKIVGFTGRLLELKDDPKSSASRGPKYWNTPETPIFTKSRTLFALHMAKHAISQEGFAILAEGQMDVVMLHQHGYSNTVASSGTALTPEQLKLLSRFTQTIVFAYDSDAAGIEATKRGIELALTQELTPYVITIPNGKDPADCLLKNPEIWKEAHTNRLRGLDWIVEQALKNAPRPLPPEFKKSLAREMVSWLRFVHDPTEQADWFLRLAARLETNEQNLRELFKRLHPETALSTSREETSPPRPQSENSVPHFIDTALAILLTFPETFPALRPQFNHLPDAAGRPLFTKILTLVKQTPNDTAVDTFIASHLTDEERKDLALQSEELLVHYSDIELSASWAITELSLILQRVRTESRDQAKSAISEEIKRAQQLGDVEKIKRLFQELQNLLY